MISALFSAAKAPQIIIAPAWPSALNPCRNPDIHSKNAYYGVHGRVTKCCSQCLWAHEEETGLSRSECLQKFFVPDERGAVTTDE